MPTVAAHNQVPVTADEQVLDVRGATGLEITISNGGVYIRFAHRYNDMTGGLGIPELHAPKILNVSDEAIDQVAVVAASPTDLPYVTVIATRD